MDTYVDPWEKAAHECVDLGLQIMKYGRWLVDNREAFELAGIDRPPDVRAVATMVCPTSQQVECVAAIMDVAVDETGSTLVSATTAFGELSVEAYAARWAVA